MHSVHVLPMSRIVFQKAGLGLFNVASSSCQGISGNFEIKRLFEISMLSAKQ